MRERDGKKRKGDKKAENEAEARGRKIHRLGEGLKMQTDSEARGEKPWRVCEKVIREGETTQREGEHRRERPGDGQTNKTGEGRKVEWRDEKSKQEYNTKQITRRKRAI